VIVDNGYQLAAQLSPFTAPGTYRVVVRNPDGQNTDENPNDQEAFIQITDSPNFWTYSQNMVMPTALEGFPSGPNGHGRLGSSMVVDPQTQKIYIFGGTSGQGSTSSLPKALLTFAESEGWRAVAGANIPTEMSARFGHTAVWIEGDPVVSTDDRMLIYGGYGQPDSGGNSSVVSDLIWLYNPNLTGQAAWQAVTIEGSIDVPRLAYAQSFWRTDVGALYLFGGIDQNGNLAADGTRLPVYRINFNAGTTAVTSASLVTTTLNNIHGGGEPSPRAFFSMAVHPKSATEPDAGLGWQQVFISGGSDSSPCTNNRTDLWHFDAGIDSGPYTRPPKWSRTALPIMDTENAAGGRCLATMVARMKPSSSSHVELFIYSGRHPNGNFAGALYIEGTLAKVDVDTSTLIASISYPSTDISSVSARGLHSSVWAGDRMYVFGGTGPQGLLTWEGIIQTVTHPATQLWRYIPVN
jgi:hypothetical protein